MRKTLLVNGVLFRPSRHLHYFSFFISEPDFIAYIGMMLFD